ncbi:MAG: sulfotransferase domain-containing protein, partial [Thermosynechococcaceae cyanobacterium]
MPQPNFLFIGPDKTGSSWMYEIFRQHPQCYVSECKDIYFFDRYYDRGLNWYFSHFRKANSDVIAIGELSHDYLFSPLAAKRIHVDLPNVKLISCLRNPIDRTFSHYLYLIRCGLTKLSFKEAIQTIPELIEHSLYYKHLSVYFSLFESSRIKILDFSDLQADSKVFAKEIFDYLNLSLLESIDYS